MYNEILKKQVHYFKETEGGREVVCQIVEDTAVKIADRIAEERAAQKVIESKVEDMKNLMETMKMTVKQAMEVLRISPAEQEIISKRI